jgi:hypothetical protein
LPELLASGNHVGISFYIEVEDAQFFVEENPGNINGAFFTVYYDGPVLEMAITRKLRSIINNNQDAIGINFTNVNLTVKAIDNHKAPKKVRSSPFGCVNCLWAGSECSFGSKYEASEKVSYGRKQVATCKGYTYYD